MRRRLGDGSPFCGAYLPGRFTVLLGEQNVTFALPHADRVYVCSNMPVSSGEGDPRRFAAEAGTGY